VRRPRAPLFLARRSYRRRRLRDAARLIPVLGVFFFLLPVLWAPGATPAPDTARMGIYLFAVWGVLIGLAFVLAPGLSADDSNADNRDADERERNEGRD